MSLFSFFRKNKQEAAPGGSDFYSRSEDEATAARTRGKRKSKQANESSDPVLPEKKRARRRLIGAVALVLAAVIGLPMVLDSEPQPLADNISIQIPSKDKPDQLRKLPAPVSAAAALDKDEQIVEPAESPIAERAVQAASVNSDRTHASSDAVSKAIVEGTQSAAPAPVPPVAKTEPHPAAKPTTLTEPKAVAKLEPKSLLDDNREDVRAKAILEGRIEPKAESSKVAEDKKPAKFVIQVAALANEEKIAELRNKLKTAGIASHTQKVATASGERTRIRVGPFATKEDAEKMQARLAKLGLNGSLVPTL